MSSESGRKTFQLQYVKHFLSNPHLFDEHEEQRKLFVIINCFRFFGPYWNRKTGILYYIRSTEFLKYMISINTTVEPPRSIKSYSVTQTKISI